MCPSRPAPKSSSSADRVLVDFEISSGGESQDSGDSAKKTVALASTRESHEGRVT